MNTKASAVLVEHSYVPKLSISVKKKQKNKIKYIFLQKIIGIGFIILSVFVIMIASTGNSVEEKDITPILLFIPIGLYMIFTKKYILNLNKK